MTTENATQSLFSAEVQEAIANNPEFAIQVAKKAKKAKKVKPISCGPFAANREEFDRLLELAGGIIYNALQFGECVIPGLGAFRLVPPKDPTDPKAKPRIAFSQSRGERNVIARLRGGESSVAVVYDGFDNGPLVGEVKIG